MSDRSALLIGLDLGTTALKCAAYTVDGDLVASSTREYSLLTPAADVVEMAPSTYWSEYVEAVHELLAHPEVEASRVRAIGISAQGETLIPVQRDGSPARNAIVWLDSRALAESDELAGRFPEQHLYEVTGQPSMMPTWPAAKVLWIARHEPDVFERTDKFLLIEDFFLGRMTGEAVAEGSLLTSTCYWDFRTRAYWPEMLSVLGIDEDRLPPIVEPGEAVGTLLPAVAAELGLPESVVVCAGALDQACGAIGAGAATPGSFSENTGAAVALCATLDEARLDPERRMPCHYHGIPGTYMFHTFTSGGVVLKWFRDQFAAPERTVAAELGVDAYELLGQEAATVPAGCEGLVMVPHLQGAMAPENNGEARGALVGLTLRHGRAHVARAILESISFVIRRNIEVLESLGTEIPEIRSLGGGSRSRVWKQIEADVTGRPVALTQQEEAATLGAAILAGVGTGLYAHAPEAAARMVHVRETFEPDPRQVKTYDDYYGLYQETYDALCPVYSRLAGVTR
ncbi:MAG: FGGY family carbohydrate kinase [Nocardioidaceae bacterium]